MVNQCNFIGNLTRDCELRYTGSGKAVANMTLAVNSKYDGKDNVLFIDVVVWGKQAENASQYLSKGSKAYVTGRLEQRSWESDTGKRTKMELIAMNVVYLTPKGDSEPPKEVSDIEPF